MLVAEVEEPTSEGVLGHKFSACLFVSLLLASTAFATASRIANPSIFIVRADSFSLILGVVFFFLTLVHSTNFAINFEPHFKNGGAQVLIFLELAIS